MAPFTVGQLEPQRGMSGLLADALAVSHTGAVDRADRADRADRSDRSGANDRESVEGVLGNSSERITLEDLLGLGREPEKRQIEIYMGRGQTSFIR